MDYGNSCDNAYFLTKLGYDLRMKIKVHKIVPHPLNSEIYELSNIDDLVKSIDEVGLLNPLVINQRNELISGHRRFEAVKQLGWKEVDVERIKTESAYEETTLLIAHNKQRVKNLYELLAEAEAIEPTLRVGQGKRTDLTSSGIRRSGRTDERIADAIGISRDRYNKIKKIAKMDKTYLQLIQDDVLSLNQAYEHLTNLTKEKQTKNRKSSQPFNEPNYTFYKKSSSNMEELDDHSVQTIFTSPPYFRKRVFKGTLGNEKSSTEFVSNLVKHLRDCWRVLKPGGSFFLNLGDSYVDGNLQNVPHKVCIGLQDQGWILRNQIVWRKTNRKPMSSKKSLTNSYEFIFHLTKSMDHDFYPTNIPAKNKHEPWRLVRHTHQGRNSKIVHPVAPSDSKNMGNFWDQDIVETAVAKNQSGSAREHPAPFPESIVALPIMQTSKEGDLILDPFSGTGTTGKVAISLNRNYVGYDIVKY